MSEEKDQLSKKIDHLKKELLEAEETIDILQRENDELRGEIMTLDQRNDFIIKEISLKIDKILDSLLNENL